VLAIRIPGAGRWRLHTTRDNDHAGKRTTTISWPSEMEMNLGQELMKQNITSDHNGNPNFNVVTRLESRGSISAPLDSDPNYEKGPYV
jgi:hypothetical protein